MVGHFRGRVGVVQRRRGSAREGGWARFRRQTLGETKGCVCGLVCVCVCVCAVSIVREGVERDGIVRCACTRDQGNTHSVEISIPVSRARARARRESAQKYQPRVMTYGLRLRLFLSRTKALPSPSIDHQQQDEHTHTPHPPRACGCPGRDMWATGRGWGKLLDLDETFYSFPSV
ncbi:hypothetical protein LX36DRAFT_390689 [Colletotrichum falcatum]|nr:hypothetical protein LX36DRAFT_390689 [Colletotrichum falcatum]